jgi:prevent-host-death family protein
MKTALLKNTKNNISDLIKNVNINHEPLLLTGYKENAVLISEDDWKSIEETNFLNSIPKLADKIINGKNTKIENCFDEEDLEW